MSSSNSPWSSAILKTSASTPCCVGFRLNRRPSSSGPRSEIVARSGKPCLPKTSQKTTGSALHSGSAMPVRCSRSFNLGDDDPAAATPDKSPFTSAMNTGTPILEKWSASIWSVTVLPVPVAPVIRPWRLARAGRNSTSSPPPVFAIANSSLIGRRLSSGGWNTKMLHQQLRKLGTLAFLFLLEIHLNVAAGRRVRRDPVGPLLDVVGRVALIPQTEVRVVGGDPHRRGQLLAVGDAQRQVARRQPGVDVVVEP